MTSSYLRILANLTTFDSNLIRDLKVTLQKGRQLNEGKKQSRLNLVTSLRIRGLFFIEK